MVFLPGSTGSPTKERDGPKLNWHFVHVGTSSEPRQTPAASTIHVGRLLPTPHPTKLNRVIPLKYLGLASLLALTACRGNGFPDYPEGYREFAYVANLAGNSVSVLDLVYLRPDHTLGVGNSPVALAVNPHKNEVYALNAQPAESAGSLSIIDTTNNSVAATLPLHRNPTALSIDPTGRFAFVANTGAGTVSTIDLDSRRIVASVPAGDRPTSAFIAPDGRTLVVTRPASAAVALYTVSTTGQLSPRATFANCPGASSPVILPDSSKAFIGLLRQPPGPRPLARRGPRYASAARQDASLLTDHLLTLLDVGDHPIHLALKPDGGEIFVSNSVSDTISEISTQSNEVGSTFGIGNHPSHAVVSADNSALWVADSGADTLSLYSIDDGKLVSSLHAGSSPNAPRLLRRRTPPPRRRRHLRRRRRLSHRQQVRPGALHPAARRRPSHRHCGQGDEPQKQILTAPTRQSTCLQSRISKPLTHPPSIKPEARSPSCACPPPACCFVSLRRRSPRQ